MVATLSGTTGGVLNVVGGLAGGSGGHQIPFSIEGTTSDPKFVPNIGGTAGNMVGSQAQSLLGGAAKSKGAASGVEGALGGAFSARKSKQTPISPKPRGS